MHLILTINNRTLGGLMVTLACAAAFLSDASVATASIVLPTYGTFALESGDFNERADLSISHTGATGSTASSQAAEKIKRASSADVCNDWQGVFLDASSSGLTGTSTPNSSPSAGPQAYLCAADVVAADRPVIGWLRDASHIGLPEAMPRGLERPPQA